MPKTTPGTAHRHKTKSGYWYDLTDEASASPHTHDVDLSGYVTRTEYAQLVARVTALEGVEPPPPPPPPPPTGTEFIPPPATSGSATLPTSIPNDGSAYVDAQLLAALNAIPSGRIVRWNPGTYKVTPSFEFPLRNNQVWDFNGATIFAADPNGQLYNSAIHLRVGHDHIQILNGVSLGSDAIPGTYGDSNGEWQHGVAVDGATYIEVKNMTIRAVQGDGLAIRGGGNHVWFHHNVIETCGRMFVAPVNGSDILIEYNTGDQAGHSFLDVEPNVGNAVRRVEMRYNTLKRLHKQTMQKNADGTFKLDFNSYFFGAQGTEPTTTIVEDINVHHNTLTEGILVAYSWMTAIRRKRIRFVDNEGMKPSPGRSAGGDGLIHFHHIDGLEYGRNKQPITSGVLYDLADSTGVVVVS